MHQKNCRTSQMPTSSFGPCIPAHRSYRRLLAIDREIARTLGPCLLTTCICILAPTLQAFLPPQILQVASSISSHQALICMNQGAVHSHQTPFPVVQGAGRGGGLLFLDLEGLGGGRGLAGGLGLLGGGDTACDPGSTPTLNQPVGKSNHLGCPQSPKTSVTIQDSCRLRAAPALQAGSEKEAHCAAVGCSAGWQVA